MFDGQIGNTTAAVENPRRNESTSGASRLTRTAASTASLRRSCDRTGRQLEIRDHHPQESPASLLWPQQEPVLPQPAQTGRQGRLPFENRPRIDVGVAPDRPRRKLSFQPVAKILERIQYELVVITASRVDGYVRSDSPGLGGKRSMGPVCFHHDDQGSSPGKTAAKVQPQFCCVGKPRHSGMMPRFDPAAQLLLLVRKRYGRNSQSGKSGVMAKPGEKGAKTIVNGLWPGLKTHFRGRWGAIPFSRIPIIAAASSWGEPSRSGLYQV